MPAPLRNRRLLDDRFLSALETLNLYFRSALGSRYTGSRRSRAYGGAADFASHREYAPGDDLRRIDWNLAGRTEQYYIKRFLDERKQQMNIYIDTSASMNGDADGNKAVYALRIAAALGYLAVRRMDSVSFRLLNGAKCRSLGETINGRASYFRELEALEEVTFSGSCDLGRAMADDLFPGFDDGMSVLVSDFLTDSDWKSTVDRLRSRKRETALVWILSPEEKNPLYRGTQALTDAENGEDVLCLDADREALIAYEEALRWLDGDMTRFCASRGTALLQVTSDEKLEDVLMKKGFEAGLIR